MMGRLGFAEAVYLLLMGELPTPAIGRMLNAVLVSSIDHGVTPPSTLAVHDAYADPRFDRDVDELVRVAWRVGSGRRRELEIEESRHLAGDAVDGQEVGPVVARLQLEHRVRA